MMTPERLETLRKWTNNDTGQWKNPMAVINECIEEIDRRGNAIRELIRGQIQPYDGVSYAVACQRAGIEP